MNNNENHKEIIEILKGIFLILGCHLLAGLIIFVLISTRSNTQGGLSSYGVLFFGLAGFFLWQLFYVIPLTIWLKRQGKTGMMKGVIFVAVMTALLNGACFLSLGF